MKPRFSMRAALFGTAALLALPSAMAATYYWDTDGATAGAGGTSPAGTWSTGGTTWSANSNGTAAASAYTTTGSDDLAFSAGINATGAYTVSLGDTQNAKSLTFEDGTATLSGAGGIINLLGAGGMITVNNGAAGIIGANTTTNIASSVGLTKKGVGTLTLNGSDVLGFTGGLNVNGGTLLMDFANLGTPTDLINSGNDLILGGGTLSIKGQATGTSSQTLGNVTVKSGGGQILGNNSGGTALNVILGSLTATASGGSLLVGNATTTAGNIAVITTTTDKDAQGIYGGRVAYFNGTANTGYDWATSSGAGPYTLAAYSGYTAMATSGTDTVNSRITAGATLTDNLTTNSLKFQAPAANQILDLGTKSLTLSSGGLLITGASVNKGPTISNGNLTAGNGSGSYDLVVHQFNAGSGNGNATSIGPNPNISAAITDNGSNAVTLVKAGTGFLMISGVNTFTGGIIVNGGSLFLNNAASLNNNAITFNANSTMINQVAVTSTGGITINNGSMVSFAHNTTSFTTSGAVTGVGGGITLAQAGGGATRVTFNSTANTFTGPIEFRVTPNAGQDGVMTVNSLADSSAIGEGNIRFGVAGTGTNSHIFNYGTGAIADLILSNRKFELVGSHALSQINNNSAKAFTINTDLLSSGTGTQTLTLGGTGTGLSSYAGKITNGTITTLNITKVGTGTWTLSGDNGYNGVTTVGSGAGTLIIASDNALGSTAANTTIATNGNNKLGISGGINSAENITITGFTEQNGFARGIDNLSGTNVLSGNITLSSITGGVRIGATDGQLTFSGIISQTTSTNALALNAAGSSTVIVNNPLANNGGNLNIYGTASGGTGIVQLNGASGSGIGNTGITTSSTLRLGVTDALNTTGNLTLGSVTAGNDIATFDLAGFNQTVNGLVGTAAANPDTSRVVTNSAASGTSILTAGNGDANSTFNGVITNGATASVALVKTGAGQLTLPGNSTYTGGTTVSSGTLTINGSLADATATVSSGTLDGSGTLTFNIDGASSDLITMTGGGLTASGLSVAINPTGSGLTQTEYVLVDATGGGTISGTFVTLIGASGYEISYATANQIKLVQVGGGSAYDTWKAQITNGLNLRTDDADSDGFTNLQEFLFGTSPIANNGSLVTTTTSGSDIILRWLQRETGSTYTLMQSATLATGSWTTAGQTPAIDGDQTGAPIDYDYFKVTIPIGSGKLFFHIEGVEN